MSQWTELAIEGTCISYIINIYKYHIIIIYYTYIIYTLDQDTWPHEFWHFQCITYDHINFDMFRVFENLQLHTAYPSFQGQWVNWLKCQSSETVIQEVSLWKIWMRGSVFSKRILYQESFSCTAWQPYQGVRLVRLREVQLKQTNLDVP